MIFYSLAALVAGSELQVALSRPVRDRNASNAEMDVDVTQQLQICKVSRQPFVKS